MSAGLEISDYGRVLQAVDEEIDEITLQQARLARRASILTLAKNKILSEVRQLASVHMTGQNGGLYGL